MFEWRYLDQDGRELGKSQPFADTESAESWMGECWEDLRDRGVEEVVLVDGSGKRVYRMALAGTEESDAAERTDRDAR